MVLLTPEHEGREMKISLSWNTVQLPAKRGTSSHKESFENEVKQTVTSVTGYVKLLIPNGISYKWTGFSTARTVSFD